MSEINFSYPDLPEVFYNGERQKYIYFGDNTTPIWPYDPEVSTSSTTYSYILNNAASPSKGISYYLKSASYTKYLQISGSPGVLFEPTPSNNTIDDKYDDLYRLKFSSSGGDGINVYIVDKNGKYLKWSSNTPSSSCTFSWSDTYSNTSQYTFSIIYNDSIGGYLITNNMLFSSTTAYYYIVYLNSSGTLKVYQKTAGSMPSNSLYYWKFYKRTGNTITTKKEKTLKYPIILDANGGMLDSDWLSNNYNTNWIRTTYGQFSNSDLCQVFHNDPSIVFNGWEDENGNTISVSAPTTVSKETILYAKWLYSTYTITFDSSTNGGTSSVSSAYTKSDGSNKLDLEALPIASKSGYYFDGWYTAASGGSKIYTSTQFSQDTTVYAQFSKIYTITFNSNGGYCSYTSLTTTEKSRLNSLPLATQGGYDFDGWYTAASGGSKISTSTQFSQDTTVYAHWIEIEIDVPDENITIGSYIYLDGFNTINFHYIPPVMDVYYPSAYYRTSILDNIISLKASSYDENSGSWNMDQIISEYEVDSNNNIITFIISENLKIYSHSGDLYDDFSPEHFVNAVQNSINDNFSLISLFHSQHPFSMEEDGYRTVRILFEDDIHPLLIDELLRCLNRVVYFESVPGHNHWDAFNLPYLSYIEENQNIYNDITVTFFPQDNEIAINSSGNYTLANITNGTRFNDWYQALNILDNGDAEIIQPVSVLDVESSVIYDIIRNSNYSDRTLIYPEINSIIMEFVPQTSNYGNAFLNSLIAKFAAVLLYSRYYDLYDSGYLSNLYKGYSGEVDSYYDPNVEGGEYETIKQQLMSELLNHFSDIRTFLDEYHFVIINSDYFESSIYHEFITIFVTELSSLLIAAFPDDYSLNSPATTTETDIIAYIEGRAFFGIHSDNNYGYLATSRSYDFFFKPLPKRNEYGYCYETIFSSLANSLNSSDNILNILNPIHDGDYYIEIFEEYTNNGDTLTTDVLNELETTLFDAGVFFHITDVSNICLSTNSNLSYADAFWYTNPNKFVEYNIQNIALRENI